MKVNQLIINGYVIICDGLFDFDEDLKRTAIDIDLSDRNFDAVRFLMDNFEKKEIKDNGGIVEGCVNILIYNDDFIAAHCPKMVSVELFGESAEFIFSGGFVDAEKKKPKRVKIGYVKVEDSIFGLQSDYESGCLFGDSAGKTKIGNLAHLGACCDTGAVYRRIETEITERDEFIEFVESKCSELNANGEWSFACIAAELFDSGRVKLLEKND